MQPKDRVPYSAIVDRPGALPLDGFQEAIRFEGVDFRYAGVDEPTLREVTLTVARGEVVAFVGMSGAGKSTLMDLLPRFHDVSVTPKTGLALLFQHFLLHEGSSVTSGVKYVLRSDVM